MTIRLFGLFLLTTWLVFGCSSPENELRKEEIRAQDGTLEKIIYYNGNEKVKEERFYPGGQLKLSAQYLNGKENGMWIYYYENGNIWSKGEFKNGVRHGIAEVYYENGKPRYKGQYENGTETGKWFFYNKNGQLVKEHNFSTP